MKQKLILLSFVFIITIIFSNQINAKPNNLTEEQKGIIGTWQLKKNISGSKSLYTEAKMFPVVFTPQSLILASDGNYAEITINEGFKEFIQTQTLPTNGKSITNDIYKIGKVTAKASWKGNGLIVNLVMENGDVIIETFELSANQKQLLVKIQMDKKNTSKITTVRRVYERVTENVENSVVQIGITDYPF